MTRIGCTNVESKLQRKFDKFKYKPRITLILLQVDAAKTESTVTAS